MENFNAFALVVVEVKGIQEYFIEFLLAVFQDLRKRFHDLAVQGMPFNFRDALEDPGIFLHYDKGFFHPAGGKQKPRVNKCMNLGRL